MGEQIARFRKKWNISQRDLAKRIGVSKMTLYRWEHSKAHPHGNHYEKLIKIMRNYK